MALIDNIDTPTGKSDGFRSPRRSIQVISFIGALPFVLLTVVIVMFGEKSGLALPLADAFKIYSALVLSFLGGIHWGLVFADSNGGNGDKTIIAALIAPLIGWTSIFVSGPMGFAFLMVAFAGQGAWDNFAAHNGLLPVWFAKSRMVLTTLAAASMAVTMYAIA